MRDIEEAKNICQLLLSHWFIEEITNKVARKAIVQNMVQQHIPTVLFSWGKQLEVYFNLKDL